MEAMAYRGHGIQRPQHVVFCGAALSSPAPGFTKGSCGSMPHFPQPLRCLVKNNLFPATVSMRGQLGSHSCVLRHFYLHVWTRILDHLLWEHSSLAIFVGSW